MAWIQKILSSSSSFFRQKYNIFFIVVTSLIIFLDQLTKWLIVSFKPEWNFWFFDLHLITNTGAGFGLLKGNAFLLGVISLIVALGVILYYQKIPKRHSAQLLTALFLGGVIGNLIDRFFRQKVIDFIDFRFWPAFNLADAAISFAVIGFIWLMWKEKEL